MFEVTIISALLYTFLFSTMYYIGLCFYARKIIVIDPWKLAFYITLFCLFGISGEILVNNVWKIIFSVPLWEYHLFPIGNGDISYFFPFIWGGLGYYRYLNDITIHHFKPHQRLKPGIIMGLEAIILELAYNGSFFVLFSSYIFYYFPGNLGPLSHLSCLQVIPFYFLVGYCTSNIIRHQNRLGYSRHILTNLLFYWMVILAIVLF